MKYCCNHIVFVIQPDYDDVTYNYTIQLPPLEDKDEFYQLGVSLFSLCVVVYCKKSVGKLYYFSVFYVHVYTCMFYIIIQIDVIWMRPAGPGRSDNCRPVGVFAPPPLPIQLINITSIEIVNVTHISAESQHVIVSARSVSQITVTFLPITCRPTYLLYQR